jgi:hypothetical protein
MPPLDLGTQPEARTTRTKIEYRSRHVRVSALVLAHGVAVRQAKDPSDLVGVDELVDCDSPGHEASLHPSADAGYACEHLSVRPRM